MGRKPRNYVEGGIYHLVQRGNNKAFVFNDQQDKEKFYAILKETLAVSPFYLLYFVLMDNHYHLLVEMQKNDFGEIMRKINLDYSKYYNKKYNRTGTIFGSRYHSKTIMDTRQYLETLRYIANNPVKARMVKHPSEYRWGAHFEIISDHPSFFAKKRMLSYIDPTYKIATQNYDELIATLQTIDEIMKKRSLALQNLLEELDTSGIFSQKIQKKDRSPDTIRFKERFIILALEKGYTKGELAKMLHMTRRGIDIRKHMYLQL